MASAAWADSFTFLPQGATIQRFCVADRNIVLGFDNPADYNADYNPYFGETIGRVANRISGAKINKLNGQSYQLAVNNGVNTNHGGVTGWGRKVFDGPHYVKRADRDAVLFTYRSHDGEEGFPGTVELNVWYTPTVSTSSNEHRSTLEVDYFNLSGDATIAGTVARLSTNLHQLKNHLDVPSGSFEPFDAINAHEDFVLGADSPDFDHCFIVNAHPESVPVDSRTLPLRQLAVFHHPASHIRLEVLSTEPAFQFYTGAFIDVSVTTVCHVQTDHPCDRCRLEMALLLSAQTAVSASKQLATLMRSITIHGDRWSCCTKDNCMTDSSRRHREHPGITTVLCHSKLETPIEVKQGDGNSVLTSHFVQWCGDVVLVLRRSFMCAKRRSIHRSVFLQSRPSCQSPLFQECIHTLTLRRASPSPRGEKLGEAWQEAWYLPVPAPTRSPRFDGVDADFHAALV
ncbi:hypothetical protein MRB53_040205 [Persea americana]|nr:hypothetical protein MRB53_040205 [Persea americana]